jgi:hypothetical protein
MLVAYLKVLGLSYVEELVRFVYFFFHFGHSTRNDDINDPSIVPCFNYIHLYIFFRGKNTH